jgi:hypothetical protein
MKRICQSQNSESGPAFSECAVVTSSHASIFSTGAARTSQLRLPGIGIPVANKPIKPMFGIHSIEQTQGSLKALLSDEH